MKKYALFDLDGCLSDDEWRLYELAAGNFDTYHSKLDCDQPMNKHHFLNVMQPGLTPVFITARPEQYRKATDEWIKRYICDEYWLLMRPDGDHQASPDVKILLLQHYSIFPSEVEAAFDDRMDVLNAYQKFGIRNCIQMDKGTFLPLGAKGNESEEARSHYMKEYKGVKLDPARICKVYGQTDILMTTIVKKALAAGERGHKDFRQDLIDIISAAERRLEMMDEDGE